MSRRPLAFRALAVRRMPGIADGGWALRDLSPEVNVVWGPNGAGKTTTAAAVQRLLWPSADPGGRAVLDALIHADGAEWRVEMDGTAVRWQRGGADTGPVPGIPSAAERDRYRLSLHELLSATDGSLAERIVHESAGGFDVAAAGEALGIKAKPGQPRNERQALDAARARLQQARDTESALRGDEARLAALRGELARHRTVAARADLWQRARERLDAREDEQTAREALSRLPRGVELLAGNEAEQLRALRGAAAEAEGRERAAARDGEAARREIEAAGLPPAGLPEGLVPGLSAALSRIQELESTRGRLERELAGARAEAAAERARVAGAVGEDRLPALDLPAVDELTGFAREAERHRAEVRAAEAELAWLLADGEPGDPEKLSRGRALLAEWLRLPEPERGPGRPGWIALASALLAAAAGAALGVSLHPAGWAVAGLALVLAALVLVGRRGVPAERAARRTEYARLGLDAPIAWEPEAVVALLERLEGRIAAARLQGQRTERRAAVEARLAELAVRTGALDGRRAELAERLGVAPAADEAVVVWLCERVHRWQVARSAAEAKEAELGAAIAQLASALEEAERAGGPFAAVSSPAELAGALEDLRERAHRFERAREQLRSAEARRAEAAADVAGHRAACSALLERAGLPADGDGRLDALCRAHPAFVEARRTLDGMEQSTRSAERRLAEAAGFEERVRAVPRAEVEAALAGSRAAAEAVMAASDEVARLEERLREARSRTEVRDALAEVDAAEAALRDCRDRDEAAVVGWALREFVERETRDRDRPAVFHRARELFAAFTRGRHRLELSPESPPSFRAVDTDTGAGCALDELSRGTRVQLLLAVRIAFLETMESGLALPLVLDEALGNSDDLRAGAVMDVVVELARTGRQIFFLTARRDEAERWMERLAATEVGHTLVDLGEARRRTRFAELPRPSAASLRLGAVRAPEDRDHAAYGALLQVPPVDVDAPADAVHLWYLVDDPARLHRLLSLGASSWGSLRTLVEHVGPGVLGPDAGSWERLDALGRAAEQLLAARRVGRGRPVEPEALERSGAISPTFMERVEAVRRGCGAHPEALLEGMERLPRFRSDSLEAFRDFLDREGYLDPRDPLDRPAVRAHLLAATAPDLRAGRILVADLERLLEMVGEEAGAAQPGRSP